MITLERRSVQGLVIAKARMVHLHQIQELLTMAVGQCVPVSQRDLARRIHDFELAVAPSGEIVGCVSLQLNAGVAELRCLAVHSAWRGCGIGQALVRSTLKRAARAFDMLFCVSQSPSFFERLGFFRLPPSAVPKRPGIHHASASRHALLCHLNPTHEEVSP